MYDLLESIEAKFAFKLRDVESPFKDLEPPLIVWATCGCAGIFLQETLTDRVEHAKLETT